MSEQAGANTGGGDAPLFEILTRSGRIAGPFSRAKLKQYASEKRLDPRLHLRKHDPENEQAWRPCWKTKGLFPREVVEACAREGETPLPAVVTATATEEPEAAAEGNWAFSDAQASSVSPAQVEVPMGVQSTEFGAIPRFESAPQVTRADRRAAKQSFKKPRSHTRWDFIGGWVATAATSLHVALCLILGLGASGAPAAGAVAPEGPGVLATLAVRVIALPIGAIITALFFLLGFLIVRVESPGFGGAYATALYDGVVKIIVRTSSVAAVSALAVSDKAGLTIFVPLSQLAFGLPAAVGIIMWRHALDPLRAIGVYALPAIVLLIIVGAAFLALAGGATAIG